MYQGKEKIKEFGTQIPFASLDIMIRWMDIIGKLAILIFAANVLAENKIKIEKVESEAFSSPFRQSSRPIVSGSESIRRVELFRCTFEAETRRRWEVAGAKRIGRKLRRC